MGAQMEKLSDASEARGVLIEFLDWIGQHPDLALGQWCRTGNNGNPLIEPRLVPAWRGSEAIIFEFLDIDAVELERERRALLAKISGKEG